MVLFDRNIALWLSLRSVFFRPRRAIVALPELKEQKMKKRLVAIIVLLTVLIASFSLVSCKKEDSADVLKIGMECGYQPYNWTQLSDEDGAVPIYGKKGQYANGYDIKIAKKIAEKFGKKLEVHAYEWDSLVPAVKSGALDLIVAGMSPTEERRAEVDFSDAYYESNLVIVVRKDGAYAGATALADFDGAAIVAQAGTFHDEAVKQIPNLNRQTPLKDFPTMITALKNKTVDGYVAEEPGAIADCNANKEFTFVPLVNDSTGFSIADKSNVTLAVGIKKGSPYKAAVNEAIAEIGTEERQTLMAQAVAQAKTLAVEVVGEDKTFFSSVLLILEKYGLQLLKGVGYTLLISLVSTLVGLLIGILIGIIKTIPPSRKRWLRWLQKIINFLLSCYIEIFRSTPMMVQAMVIYWGYAFISGGTTLPLLPSAIFIVSINTGAYIAEIVRGGILSIDKGQYEGAESIGMTHFQIMLHVVIPQVIRNILPAVSNEFVINIKDTSVLNVIGVAELFYQATVASKATYAIFETYAIICVIYFILTFTVTRLLRLAEKALSGNKNYTVCGSQSDSASTIKISKEGLPND